MPPNLPNGRSESGHGVTDSGINPVGIISWGTHFCSFYENINDHLDTVAAYFRSGVLRHEACLWIAAPPLKKDRAIEDLSRWDPLLSDAIKDRAIEVADWDEWYIALGQFDPERVIRGWDQRLSAALDHGHAGLRVAANEAWLTYNLKRRFCCYERSLNRSLGDKNIVIMCCYPTSGSTAADVFDVAATHQFALAHRHGAWEVMEVTDHVGAVASER
ncbi:MAG TPA: MEDS domain-containing protein [Sphingomonas sp.]|nr:MEDS domain-containing protein [Sphingomonas sp.]